MSTDPQWPDPEKVVGKEADARLELFKSEVEAVKEGLKAEHQARIQREKDELERDAEREKAEYANQYAILQQVNNGYVEVAKKAMDRSFQRADFVQKVAAAIGTLYTGVIAFSFSLEEDLPLPITGLAPAIFLGLALALASIYIAHLGRPGSIQQEPSGGTLRADQNAQRNTFIKWNRSAVLQNGPFLTASAVSLGVGVALLPLPYLSSTRKALWLAVGIGAVVVVLAYIYQWYEQRKESHEGHPDRPTIPVPKAKGE